MTDIRRNGSRAEGRKRLVLLSLLSISVLLSDPANACPSLTHTVPADRIAALSRGFNADGWINWPAVGSASRWTARGIAQGRHDPCSPAGAGRANHDAVCVEGGARRPAARARPRADKAHIAWLLRVGRSASGRSVQPVAPRGAGRLDAGDEGRLDRSGSDPATSFGGSGVRRTAQRARPRCRADGRPRSRSLPRLSASCCRAPPSSSVPSTGNAPIPCRTFVR